MKFPLANRLNGLSRRVTSSIPDSTNFMFTGCLTTSSRLASPTIDGLNNIRKLNAMTSAAAAIKLYGTLIFSFVVCNFLNSVVS